MENTAAANWPRSSIPAGRKTTPIACRNLGIAQIDALVALVPNREFGLTCSEAARMSSITKRDITGVLDGLERATCQADAAAGLSAQRAGTVGHQRGENFSASSRQLVRHNKSQLQRALKSGAMAAFRELLP